VTARSRWVILCNSAKLWYFFNQKKKSLGTASTEISRRQKFCQPWTSGVHDFPFLPATNNNSIWFYVSPAVNLRRPAQRGKTDGLGITKSPFPWGRLQRKQKPVINILMGISVTISYILCTTQLCSFSLFT
jgi:hypothetical protein